jgi:hypothetical protein
MVIVINQNMAADFDCVIFTIENQNYRVPDYHFMQILHNLLREIKF